jgi:16S rRNA (cytosine1402-N4)-methyltransferase
MATHHRLVERSSRCPPGPRFCQQCRRDLRGRDLRARRAQPPDPVAAGPAGPAGGLRQGPRGGGRSGAHHRCALSIRHQGFSHLGELPPQQRGRRADGPGRELAADRQPGAGFFSFRSTARWTCAWTPRAAQRGRVAGNSAEVQQIAEVIRDYGEERFAVQIAKAIAARRQERGPVSTTAELAQLVAGAVKTREPGQDPATRTFQALRIFINAELEELQQALEASLDVLATRRPAGGDQLPFAGRPHRQAVHRGHSREVVDRRAPFAAPRAMKLRALAASSRPPRRSRPTRARAAPSCAWPRGQRHDAAEPRPAAGGDLASALYLVRVQYESRRLFTEIDRARRGTPPRGRAERLQVEKRAQATPAARGKLAREQLQMRPATPAITQYVKLRRRRRPAR